MDICKKNIPFPPQDIFRQRLNTTKKPPLKAVFLYFFCLGVLTVDDLEPSYHSRDQIQRKEICYET